MFFKTDLGSVELMAHNLTSRDLYKLGCHEARRNGWEIHTEHSCSGTPHQYILFYKSETMKGYGFHIGCGPENKGLMCGPENKCQMLAQPIEP